MHLRCQGNIGTLLSTVSDAKKEDASPRATTNQLAREDNDRAGAILPLLHTVALNRSAGGRCISHCLSHRRSRSHGSQDTGHLALEAGGSAAALHVGDLILSGIGCAGPFVDTTVKDGYLLLRDLVHEGHGSVEELDGDGLVPGVGGGVHFVFGRDDGGRGNELVLPVKELRFDGFLGRGRGLVFMVLMLQLRKEGTTYRLCESKREANEGGNCLGGDGELHVGVF